MHEYGGDILYGLKLKHGLRSNSISSSFFTTQLGHGHGLATIAIILDF